MFLRHSAGKVTQRVFVFSFVILCDLQGGRSFLLFLEHSYKSAVPKVNRKKGSVCSGRTVAIARAEIVVIGQDDGFMRRVVHPPIHSVLGVIRCTRTGVDDFSAPPAGIARRNFTLPIGGSIRAVV